MSYHQTLRVFMESEPYGREYFDGYDSLTEQLQAVERLTNNASELAAQDGIERIVGVVVVPVKQTVEISIHNNKGPGSHTTTVDFASFEQIRSVVDELIDELGFRKVDVELTPNWKVNDQEACEFNIIENQD